MRAASCLASCCAACACEACRTVVSSISRKSARIAYCGLFAFSLIVSWILREVAAPLMEKIPWINHFHQTPDREWFETNAVLRRPAVNESLLPASVISVYCTYLCYSGLASEPRDYECNGLHNHSKAVSTGSLTLGLLTTVLSVVYSAVRAGSSTTLLEQSSGAEKPLFLLQKAEKPLIPFSKLDEQQEDTKKDDKSTGAVTYSYSFFHIIFSLASMYSAMLLTGWSTSVGESENLVDVGWPSVWVRILTGWATARLYIWSLVAPLLFPEREF